MLSTPAVLAVLVEDRRLAITRDYASSRRFRLRRRLATAVHILAAALAAVASAVDEPQIA